MVKPIQNVNVEGNYFVTGGQISGKKILGKYPSVLDATGPLRFEPGIGELI